MAEKEKKRRQILEPLNGSGDSFVRRRVFFLNHIYLGSWKVLEMLESPSRKAPK